MKIKRILVALALLFMAPSVLHAQGIGDSLTGFYILSGFILLVAILVLVVAIVVLQLLRLFVRQEIEQKAAEQGVVLAEEESWWRKFISRANDTVPLEEEDTIMLDHDYDGIKELDNHLPPWWKWLFYMTVVFGVVYMIVYHVTGTLPLQADEYQAEVAVAEEARLARLGDQPASNIDENNVTFVDDPTALAQGKQVYKLNCAACHKEDGGGGIGPNLTDEYWLHGGSIQDIYRTIKVGVPEKGMIAWEATLSPEKIQHVASYIITLQGTSPANPKKPQGELFIPEKEEVASDSTQMAKVEE